MTTIALFGAGGKMEFRVSADLKGSRFDVRHAELSDTGKVWLKGGTWVRGDRSG